MIQEMKGIQLMRKKSPRKVPALGITTYEQYLVNEDVSLSNTTLLRGVSIASLMNNTLISIEGMHNK